MIRRFRFRFRYLDESIAVVLALVAVKLLLEDVVKVGPVATLGIVAVAFTIGIVASIRADRRDPDSEQKRDERDRALRVPQASEPEAPAGEPEAPAGEPQAPSSRS